MNVQIDRQVGRRLASHDECWLLLLMENIPKTVKN